MNLLSYIRSIDRYLHLILNFSKLAVFYIYELFLKSSDVTNIVLHCLIQIENVSIYTGIMKIGSTTQF